MSITHNSLASLHDSVESLMRDGDLETPLEMIQAFVQRIVSDPLATGRIFSAPALDELCLRLGALVLSQTNVVTPVPSEGRIVYVATEFYLHGGHTLLAADFVRNLPDREHVFLLTDVLGNPHRDAPDLRLVSLGAKVEVAPTGLKLEKLKWLLTRLFELTPEKIYWFSHHQDAVAIAAAQPAIPGDKYFIHHADHQLCLGVHAPHLRHVDLSNIGFFNCRDVLGIANNQYWPLVCDDLGPRDQGRRFIEAGRLRTCSSGSGNKFEIPYMYAYADVIPRVLRATGGEHVHFGHLSEEYLEGIRRRLAEARIPQERFVHISWVPSLWHAMIDRKVDVYLMSWPIGGGKALIEAMGAGIPPILHVNYISRHHSGFDLAPAEAPIWRTPTELADLLGAFTPESLAFQSLSARAHYEKHHTPEILASLLRGDAGAAPAPIPLRDYHSDRLQTFLDERTQRDEPLRLEQAVAERDGQIASLNQAVAELNGQIEQILRSTSWKVSAPIRWAGYHFQQVRKLIACLALLGRDPRKIPSTLTRMHYAWGRGGMLAVKQLLLQLPSEVSFNEVWLQYRQTFTPDVETDIRGRIGRMEGRPLISILMPVYNTPEGVLRETIESVLAQLYPDWELCVVDDASSQPQVRCILEEFSAKDSRIRVEFGEHNGGISRATNRALTMARGAFVALLDHDDLLEKQALFRLAESILVDDPDMIYSDEAILSEDGVEVVNHVYRPAFSPERLRSCPYIVHLVAFRTDLLREIGGLDASLAISQDYDLILRASEKARAIVHIPEILYLWRQRKNSAGHKIKSEVMETSRQVLARHLGRCGERGEVKDGLLFNYYEVRYPIEPGQRVAIIIPTKNHGKLVRQCVESIERTVSGVPYDIVVIDHASTDPESLAYFRQLSSRHRLLRYEGPFNFSSINNWAVAQLDGEYTHYLFCNNDIETIKTGWLERMMELCQKPDVGIVGAKLFYPDGRTLQHAGVCVGMFGIAEHYAKWMDDRLPNGGIHPGHHGTLIANHEVSAVTAACALMRRDAFERIGGFDEAIAVGFGDVDMCLRTLKAGYRILFCPHASLIHHESYTRGKKHKNPHPEDSSLFTKKWRKFLDKGDPYYNPNLAINSTQWEIRLPMEFNLHIGRRVIRCRPMPKA